MKVNVTYYRISSFSAKNFDVGKRGRPLPECLIRYDRHNGKFVGLLAGHPSQSRNSSFNDPYVKGGKTVCEIVTDGGDVFYGEAFCSMSDNFSYKTGRAIAVGRAMKAMQSSIS